MWRLLASWLLGLTLAAAGLRAETTNLVSVRHGPAPTPAEADPVIAPAGAAGPVLATAGGNLWQLDGLAASWTPLKDRLPPGRPLGTVTHGGRWLWLVSETSGPLVGRISLYPKADSPPWPDLPEALAEVRGVVQGARLFLAGLDATGRACWWSLDLAAPQPTWQVLAPWAATAPSVTSLATQDGALQLTVPEPDGVRDVLWQWTPAAGWRQKARLPGRVVDGGARPIGQAHVLFLVTLPDGLARLCTYHTITAAVANQGEAWGPAARRAAAWGNGFLWEQTGGGFRRAEIEGHKILLQPLDWVVLVIYLAAMSGIGLYFYLREKKHSTADFFVGGRSIPFWAAGISLYATNTSSISYIAIPAKAFATNWQYLMNNLIAVLGLLFVAAWIVPLLRRLNLMSVFHYLEIRFHPGIRTLTSALCIAMQLGGRMSVVLFLPSLAISTITGLHVVWSILIMGAVTIGYTTLGGMKAVIWTDFVQLFVMFGGALFAIGYIVLKLDGGLGEFTAVAAVEDKTRLFDWSFDLTKATVWGFVFLVFFDVVLTFPKDQVLMQRVLSTRSDREAGRSVWTFAAIMVPGGFMFYLIGTALYVFYQSHPERMNPLLTTDATFPLFIAAELPVGVTGLIIAGICAASMSTLSSIMNSVATLASVDFYEKWVKRPDPARSVRVAEWMTVGAGLVGMGLALLLTRYDVNSLFDVSIELSGLLSGGFAGAYTLGMFTRRANWQGVAIGITVSIAVTVAAWLHDLVHPYFYMPISILVCIVAGWLGSHLFPPPKQSLEGLTIYRSPAPPAV